MAERDNQGGDPRAILGGETEDKDRALRWLRSSRIPAGIRERVRSYAPLGLPVFLQGEKGTGKSEVARALHFLGPRKEGLLLRLPCRGLTWPKFGERLSLWLKSRPSANAIPLTLYWEDVEFLQEELQALLVDILADRRVPWPGLNEMTLDVGVLSSSCLPLADAVSDGKFREDLFWSLETLTLYLPPLRERREEIPRLAGEILREKTPPDKEPKRFSPEALRALQGYDWPGNLPELESLLLRSGALTEEPLLRPEHLAFRPFAGVPGRGETLPPEEKDPWFEVTIPTLAHEIKNPLVAISTFAHLLPDKFEDPEFRQEFSRLVNQDIRRINDLLENLMEFAQFSPPRRSLLDLNGSLEEVLRQQAGISPSGGKDVLTDLGKGLPPILFDKARLGFVLRNLVENALSEARQEGPLHLSTRLSSEDRACGGKEFVDLILWYNSREGALRTFSRVAGLETGADFQNLNVALLLVRRLMVRNGGKMQVLQEDDGGMTVRLQFPAGKRGEGALRESDAQDLGR